MDTIEAIKVLNRFPVNYIGMKIDEANRVDEALAMAIRALRPVSREQVEKVWRGEWVHKRSPYDYKIFVCKKCGKQISIQGGNLNFCPKCGSAQTDKAVDILLKRLEALKDGSTTD